MLPKRVFCLAKADISEGAMTKLQGFAARAKTLHTGCSCYCGEEVLVTPQAEIYLECVTGAGRRQEVPRNGKDKSLLPLPAL